MHLLPLWIWLAIFYKNNRACFLGRLDWNIVGLVGGDRNMRKNRRFWEISIGVGCLHKIQKRVEIKLIGSITQTQMKLWDENYSEKKIVNLNTIYRCCKTVKNGHIIISTGYSIISETVSNTGEEGRDRQVSDSEEERYGSRDMAVTDKNSASSFSNGKLS